MKNIDVFKILLIAVLTWIAFSIHRLADSKDEIAAGTFIPRESGFIDTRTGEYYKYGAMG